MRTRYKWKMLGRYFHVIATGSLPVVSSLTSIYTV